jgi:hypothetical protein
MARLGEVMPTRQTKLNRRKHAKRRLWQRYGVAINRDEIDRLEELIRAGCGTVLEVQSRKRKVVLVEGLLAVYKSGQIVTFLPDDWYERRVQRDLAPLLNEGVEL